MIVKSPPKALLDTNVLFPVIIRDLLFWYAHYELFTPYWSKDILLEWKEVCLRKGLTAEQAELRVRLANKAFPEALTKGYQQLIEKLELPDEKDRLVLAAAIKSGAGIIVTNNVKDFPKDYLAQFSIVAVSADNFLSFLTESEPSAAAQAFQEMVSCKKKPPLTKQEVLSGLIRCQLVETATLLEKTLGN